MIAPRTIRQREISLADHDLTDDVDPIILRVLLARGISSQNELSLGLQNMLLPDSLGGVEAAATLLAEAVAQDRQRCVAPRGCHRESQLRG
jgi:hypothetical protein